jgi:myo-inositol-1(or 4)-monophosphatase
MANRPETARARRQRPGAAANSLKRELSAARKAAIAAGDILRRHWRERGYELGSKGHDNPVTSADLEADRAIRAILRGSFPGYGWLSEESVDDHMRLGCSRVWIVDPLDGTKEFIRGIPEFAVAIALAEGGTPVLGVTYNPIKRELFWAARGIGCHLGTRRARVTRTRLLGRAVILASRSETARGEWRELEKALKVRPTGSVAYKLALIAAGRADATFTRTPKNEWDIASGAALVTEAGGRITDIDGGELRFNKPSTRLEGVVASNGILHAALMKIAAGEGAAPTGRAKTGRRQLP